MQSIDGMTAIFILYDWTTNIILTTPVKDVKEGSTIEAFKSNVKYLSKRGFKQKYNIMDNIVSKSIRAYLEGEKIAFQLVKPHNHQTNNAEQAVQTFKNHLIAGLCTCDENFPSLLWPQSLQQAHDALNMLQTSRVHPQLSAYHVLEGAHDYN